MANMDIFNQNAFSMVELTDAVDNIEYQPSLLRDLNLFERQPVRSTTIEMESRDGKISLVPVSERGSPLEQSDKAKRNIRFAKTLRLAKGDRLNSDEIQGIRAFGKETELLSVKKEVKNRIMSLQSDIELTEEYMMLGAVQGKVIDADGTTVVNDWYDHWGVTKPTELNFDLANASTEALIAMVKKLKRNIMVAGKGGTSQNIRIIALCGEDFHDKLQAHEAVKGNIGTFTERQALADKMEVFAAFDFGGITWIEYRGTDDGSKVIIETDKVKFFPSGVKGLFKHALSPAESFEYVNTLGKERYALTIPDKERNSYVDIELYTYPLFYCTKPLMLRSGRMA